MLINLRALLTSPKHIYKLRKEIISFINNNDKINSIKIEEEEDAFNEDLFYNLISK